MYLRKPILFILVMVGAIALCGCGSVEKNDALSRGTVDGNTYTNEVLKLGCVLGDGWTFCSDDEISELNGSSTKNTALLTRKQIEQSGILYDMLAKDDGTGSVSLSYEKLNIIYSGAHTPADYVDRSRKKLNSVLKQQKFTDIRIEDDEMLFCGKNWRVLRISAVLQEYPFYETLLFLPVDEYMACLSIGSYNTDIAEDVLKGFYAL